MLRARKRGARYTAATLLAALLMAGAASASPGALDPFGNSGTVIMNVNPGADMYINSIAIDGQDRIVAAGYEGNQITVARYLPNGSLDTTFGGSGIGSTSRRSEGRSPGTAGRPG
jgi:hypothetical protein